jgi:hypothetical protein
MPKPDADLFTEPVSIVDVIRHAESLAAFGRELTERSERFLEAVRGFTSAPTDQPKPKPHPIKTCLTYFDNAHLQKFKLPAKIDGGKDSAIMKRLIDRYGEPQVCEFIDRFFESDDEFITQKTGFTVGAFSSRVAALVSSSAIAPRTMGLSKNTRDNDRNAQVGANMIQRAYGNVPRS